MGFIVFDLLAGGIGWLYLFLRYRSKEKRKTVLQKDYAGSYELVGKERMVFAFALVIAILFLVFILTFLLKVAKAI